MLEGNLDLFSLFKENYSHIIGSEGKLQQLVNVVKKKFWFPKHTGKKGWGKETKFV